MQFCFDVWSVIALLISLLILLLTISASAESLTIKKAFVHAAAVLERPADTIDATEQSIVKGTWSAPTDKGEKNLDLQLDELAAPGVHNAEDEAALSVPVFLETPGNTT